MHRSKQMLRINMQSISVFLAFLAVSASASQLPLTTNTSHEYSCIGSRKPCTLQDVVLESESELDRVTFPDITDQLIIESGKIPNFTRKLTEKLARIVDLTINRLQLKTLYVKPEITHLAATDNQIETLLLDNNQSKIYEILSLDLTGNKLSDVEVLSRFTKLQQLTLDGNSLDRLSMDFFTGMSELRKLSLANNQLYNVDTKKTLQLLKLRSLSLAGNQLVELNVEKWELVSLMELDISNNQLYLLHGSLGQFTALVDVKISKNYWKCEVLVGIIQLERLKFDHDESDRCKKNDLSDVKQVCCKYDASTILDTIASDDFGLFNNKWEELRQLNESFQQFKNTTEQDKQRIGELEEDKQITLVERIKQLEDEQKKIWDKLNDQESVAVKETNELKKDISFHNSTIENLKSKQSDLDSELEGFVEILNSLRERMDEKFDAVDEVKKKMADLENKSKEVEAIEKRVTAVREKFKHLEVQQIKYFLSSADLKSQIIEVKGQYSKLVGETDQLRNQMGYAQEDIQKILNILDEIEISET
ncbi:uncharacterized protein LOC135704513 [Ochlerotatus camptorhynchus]|uniref:uncharacterized protein LOC135704513 n=1 Tax=Ochlerotatus camptorhynchus TaxID=644619 RepID=UPI0031D9567E